MRILHLVSNFRWTERIEPAADLAIGQTRLGHAVRYLCGRNQGAAPEDCIQGRAQRKGLVYDDRLHLTKHLEWAPLRDDLHALRGYLDDFQPDVIHTHLPNAHLLAAWAIRGRHPRPVLVRTLYESGVPQWPLRYMLFSRPRTDGLIVMSETERAPAAGRFRREPERVAALLPGIDIEEFSGRPELGPLAPGTLPADAFVLGMVTAIGKRRRIDLALEAVARLAPRHPRLHLLICGRGKPEQCVHEPARKLGITDRVHLAGYCRNEDLVRAYRRMHALIYPRHGTDQSCRTVREALASGRPVVASDVGVVRDLIREGQTGYVTAFRADALAYGVERILQMEPARLEQMNQAAQQDARERFCRIQQAERVVTFYERLGEMRAKG